MAVNSRYTGSWWLTTLGGLLASAASGVATSHTSGTVRTVAGAVAMVLGTLLGVSHPGMARTHTEEPVNHGR